MRSNVNVIQNSVREYFSIPFYSSSLALFESQVQDKKFESINLYVFAILMEKFYGHPFEVFIISFSRYPHDNVLDISRNEGRRPSFLNRHKTKDDISSIILGFTAIFTELRLDVLFNIVYELWQKFFVDAIVVSSPVLRIFLRRL